MKNCFKSGIFWQGLTHDLSKFSPEEFFVGVSHYQGTRSPNEGEREDYGYSKAWMHHKGRNKHHFEYWTDYNVETRILTPIKMPKKYVIEMFCDRVAASKVYKGEDYTQDCPLQYFMNGKKNRNIHPETSKELERLLKMLAEKGEKYTFAHIRRARFLGKRL
jgi:pyrroloquinoline quinone (PQQ) biosynthesis protein C